MSLLLNLIFLFFFRFSLIESTTTIKASKGIKDISYNYEQNITTFKIPIDEDDSYGSPLTLTLLYPQKINRAPCEATCTKDATNLLYECQITQSNC
jgi:hypothetical protein